MSDDAITAVFCHACGGAIPAGVLEHCPACKSPLADLQRRTTRIALARDFAAHARALCDRLDARGATIGDALSSRGRVMAEAFDDWERAMPDQAERSRQIQALADWQRRGEDFLTGSLTGYREVRR